MHQSNDVFIDAIADIIVFDSIFGLQCRAYRFYEDEDPKDIGMMSTCSVIQRVLFQDNSLIYSVLLWLRSDHCVLSL